MGTSTCSYSMPCSSEKKSSSSDIGSEWLKFTGIVFGALVGLGVLVCLIVVIYKLFCQKNRKVAVWVHPAPRPQTFTPTAPTFPYSNYPREFVPPSRPQPKQIIEEPPPPYEELDLSNTVTTRV